MSYIERKPITVERLTCSHPKVKHIWEVGAFASIPTSQDDMVRIVCLLLTNEEKVQFEDNGDGQAIIDAEKFLETL